MTGNGISRQHDFTQGDRTGTDSCHGGEGEYLYLGLPYLFRVASDSIHTDRVKLVSWGAGRRLDDSSGSFGPMSY